MTDLISSHETRLQQSPVCPHCGYKHDDAWEWNFGPALDGDSEGRQCYQCEGEFDCERVVADGLAAAQEVKDREAWVAIRAAGKRREGATT